ncbi:hypothetical protein ID866_6399 [Astraeus odoratus]|nr:hypothetical protein ID866_6399 [Astraeus odoratus]
MSTNPAQAVQGPFLIGLTLNIFLQGIATAQVYLYFTTYKKDRLWIKIFLMLLYLADTLNCALSIFYVYDSLVNHWSDTAYLEYANWAVRIYAKRYLLQLLKRSNAPVAILSGVIAGMVQLFFAWRVHVLTKSIIVVLAITVCSMANMAGSLGATVSVSINPAFSNLPDLKPQVTVCLNSRGGWRYDGTSQQDNNRSVQPPNWYGSQQQDQKYLYTLSRTN